MNEILNHKPIVVEIFKHVSIDDLFIFASTCKYLYNDWFIKNTDCLNLKKRLFERFKWSWLPSLSSEKLLMVFRKRLNEIYMDDETKRYESRHCTGNCGLSVNILNTGKFFTSRIMHRRFSKMPKCGACFNYEKLGNDNYWTHHLGEDEYFLEDRIQVFENFEIYVIPRNKKRKREG